MVKRKTAVIHRKAYYKAFEGHIADEISESNLKALIHEVAGKDPRTVGDYIERLKEQGRVSESLRDDHYKVDEPQPTDLLSQMPKARTTKRYNIPAYVNQIADKFNLNMAGVITNAILEQAALKYRMAEDFTTHNSFEEIDYMLTLIQQDLHRKGLGLEKEHSKTRQRVAIYEEMFPETDNPHKYAEELRQKAFYVAEQLGIEQKQFPGQL